MNRLERHRALTIAVILGLVLVASLAISELVLGALGADFEGSKRHLLLSEWNPNKRISVPPPTSRVANAGEPADRSYSLTVDDNGFIEPSAVNARPDIEIAFLGGSTTECLYVRPQNRFPFLAGRFLEQQTGLKINTLNAARSGNNVMHSNLVFLGKILGRRPRIVVLMHGVNDLSLLRRHGSYWTSDSIYRLVAPARDGLTGGLRTIRDALIPLTYGRVHAALHPAQGPPRDGAFSGVIEPQEIAAMTASFESALRTFVRAAKAWEVDPVLMTEVVQQGEARKQQSIEGEYLAESDLRRSGLDRTGFESMVAAFNTVTRQVASSEGAVLIDLESELELSATDQYDGLHYTDAGSLKVARMVADRLNPLVQRAFAADEPPGR